jgi:uncharacterized protein (DUF697 family)
LDFGRLGWRGSACSQEDYAMKINTSMTGVVMAGVAAGIIYFVIAFVTGASAVGSIIGGIVVAAIAVAIGFIFREVFKRRAAAPTSRVRHR